MTMYVHIRQISSYRDGTTRENELDEEMELPHPRLDWKDCPLGYLLLRDVLLPVAPLACWELDDPQDAFQGVTARYVGKDLCNHADCPRGVSFFAWLDAHPTQAALPPQQEREWRARLSFLREP